MQINGTGNAQNTQRASTRSRFLHRAIPIAIAAGLAAIVALTLPWTLSANDDDRRAGGTLVGTWLNQVEIVPCPPATDRVLAAFESMTTYMRDGVLIEGGSPAAQPPAVSRSAGHGIWARTSARTFVVFFRFHSFNALGRLVSITEVTTRPRFIRGDNPDTTDHEPYYLRGNGTNRITNLNPDTGAVINVIEGCNRATSLPFLFQGQAE